MVEQTENQRRQSAYLGRTGRRFMIRQKYYPALLSRNMHFESRFDHILRLFVTLLASGLSGKLMKHTGKRGLN
jgi:hypothetical protein